jgi:large subunit ribosomal protein L9
VEQHKKNQKPRKLRGKHFNYVLVEDTNIKKQPDLKVILTQFVEGVGKKGDIVALRPNYVYKNLLLPGLAVYHTPENLEKYKSSEIAGESSQPSSQFAQRVIYKCLYVTT